MVAGRIRMDEFFLCSDGKIPGMGVMIGRIVVILDTYVNYDLNLSQNRVFVKKVSCPPKRASRKT